MVECVTQKSVHTGIAFWWKCSSTGYPVLCHTLIHLVNEILTRDPYRLHLPTPPGIKNVTYKYLQYFYFIIHWLNLPHPPRGVKNATYNSFISTPPPR